MLSQPIFRHTMDRIETNDLDEDIRSARQRSIYKFKISQRCKERRAAAGIVVPTFSVLKTERGKEALQPVKPSRSAGGTHQRNALDHSSRVSLRHWPLLRVASVVTLAR